MRASDFATWIIRNCGKIVAREKGKLIYSGLEAEMPDDIRQIVTKIEQEIDRQNDEDRKQEADRNQKP